MSLVVPMMIAEIYALFEVVADFSTGQVMFLP